MIQTWVTRTSTFVRQQICGRILGKAIGRFVIGLTVFTILFSLLNISPILRTHDGPNLDQTVNVTTRVHDVVDLVSSPNCGHDFNPPTLKAENIFHDYDPYNPPVFHVKDENTDYFVQINGTYCLQEGTELEKTQMTATNCICKSGWYGEWCSFPEVLKHSQLPKGYNFKPRIGDKPRRILSMTLFNMEFDMIEARFAELWDVVDVFAMVESNYTFFGEQKPLRLLEKLRSGLYRLWQDKIIYTLLDQFPEGGRENGWLADDLPRNILGYQTVQHQMDGLRDDDVFLLQDTDEIPTRDVILFLKLHSGYPEPVDFHYYRTTYGYYWRDLGGNWPATSASSIGFLHHVLNYEGVYVRKWVNIEHKRSTQPKIDAFVKQGGLVKRWKIGSPGHYAGWHCSWCFTPEHLLVKLQSLMNADYPGDYKGEKKRWSDYPEKMSIPYLTNLIKTGYWFNDRTKLDLVEPSFSFYAIPHHRKHWDLYKHLLENPYKDV